MNKYTVLLRYPDYMTGDWPNELYVAHVTGCDPEEAVSNAWDEVATTYKTALTHRYDMQCIFICEGHVSDLSKEASL